MTTNKPEMTHHRERVALRSLGPDELKSLFISALVSMKIDERENFVRALEIEMRRANFSMRAYLVPLGIPGRSPGELTPAEIGHLIRFLKMAVPKAMIAVEQVATRYGAFAKKMDESGGRLAA